MHVIWLDWSLESCNISGRSVCYVFSIGMFPLTSVLMNWHLLRGNTGLGADISMQNFKLDLHTKAVVMRSRKNHPELHGALL